MKKLMYLPLSLLFGFIASCGDKQGRKSPNLPSAVPSPKRVMVSDKPEVVLIQYAGSLRCTGTILDHGVILTARHCFDNGLEKDVTKITAKAESVPDHLNLTITQMLALSFDSGNNDFAWLTYPREQTSSLTVLKRVDLDRLRVPKEGEQISLVGYPVTSSGDLLKLMTSPCLRLKRQGEILPLPEDPGYLGTLYDTNCIAWRGNSGGPLFSMKTSANGLTFDKLVGVVTHTFDLSDRGSILGSALGKDEFGTYVKTVNFSSITAAKDVDLYLK